MYMLRAKPWARTRGVEEHTSLEHIVVRSGVHIHMERCALLIQGAVCAHTRTSVHTYMEQCVHCTYKAHCVLTHKWRSSSCEAATAPTFFSV